MNEKDSITPASDDSALSSPHDTRPGFDSRDSRKGHFVSQQLNGGYTVEFPPKFTLSSLWKAPQINALNYKSYTLPIFNFANPYTRNFHLAWLGFFCAFTSWFAFPPLIPEAIKADLGLSAAEVGNSNIVALCATLVVRLVLGPLTDRYGPRVTMAALLFVGAIPSGLAGAAHNAGSLFAIRFFIGILGGTFVPCLTWTTVFFDKSCVGLVNGLVGGWGNMGGGATYAIMVSLYEGFVRSGISQRIAWRVSFVAVPVPILLIMGVLVLIFGSDSPAGKWSLRHTTPATTALIMQGEEVHLDAGEQAAQAQKKNDKESRGNTTVQEVNDDDDDIVDTHGDMIVRKSAVDTAVNETMTGSVLKAILLNPLTWLPAIAYATTFGFELAIDSNLGAVYLQSHPKLGQTNAGYLASIFGFLNLFTRPLGGYCSDVLYRRYGVKAKVWFTLGLGMMQGVLCVGCGLYLQLTASPSIAGLTLFVVAIAFANEFANGANFSLVPHCNVRSSGTMSGIVGAFGNVGGILMAVVWRFLPAKGQAFWVNGAIALGVNFLLLFIRHPPS